MRKYPQLNPAALLALASMLLPCPAALAQQSWGGWQAVPGAAANPTQTNSPAAATPGSGRQQEGGIALQLMDVLVLARPSVRLDMQHNDNIFVTPNKKVSDQILVLTPALELSAKKGNNSFSLRLSSVIGQHQNNRAENYTNTSLGGRADLDLGTRLRTRLEGDYVDGSDPRGSSNNAISPTPDHYRQTRGLAVVSYGARGARGRLDLELGQLQRKYLNNRASTAASDRAVDDLGATFNWRVWPKTTLLLQGKHSRVDYESAASTLGSKEMALLLGASWTASAKTAGTFKFGLVKKQFDDPARASATTISWSGAVRWSPRTYSHVDLNLNRVPAETSGGVGNFIDRTTTGARWTHAWSSRFSTEASASYLIDAYQGAARTDHTQDFGLRASYKMRRWLSLGGGYVRSVRNSDDSNFDYQRNLMTLFVEAAL